MKIHIIYQNYLNPDGNGMSIGGVQTYLTNLTNLFLRNGFAVTIYQRASVAFEKEWNGAIVKGFAYNGKRAHLPSKIFKHFKKEILKNTGDLLLFGDDFFIVKTKGIKSIAVQHGIAWDIPKKGTEKGIRFLKEYILKACKAWRKIKRVKNVDTLVCVDYNYWNWYKALVGKPQIKARVIPNFTNIPTESVHKSNDNIKIIFARRFFHYRGTRIFAEAIERLLTEGYKIDVTLAGEGADESWLKGKLEKYERVHFLKYNSNESFEVHKDKDIAVIPTVGSEGTSLSLLEAMACGCAVICSNVGGMTSIVIDNYNGMVIEPTSKQLYLALKKMIENKTFREAIARKGRETVEKGFSKENWEKKWEEVLINMIEQH